MDYICTCIYVHACPSGTIYGAYHTTLSFSIHMQVLNDGYIHPIHPPCPFPLHCSPLCVALSKGSVLIILVILSFVMSLLPADSDQQKHAAHGIQATLFQDRCHHFRCSQREQGAAALLKYIHTQSHICL